MVRGELTLCCEGKETCVFLFYDACFSANAALLPIVPLFDAYTYLHLCIFTLEEAPRSEFSMLMNLAFPVDQ